MNTTPQNLTKNNAGRAPSNKVETLLLERILTKERKEILRLEQERLMILQEIYRSRANS